MESNAESLKNEGNRLFQKKKFDQAIECYTQAIEASMQSPSHIYYANRAFAYLSKSEYDSAVEDCNIAISIKPDYVKAHYRKTPSLIGLANYQAAQETLTEAKRIDQNVSDNAAYIAALEEKLSSHNALMTVFDVPPLI